LLQDSIFLFLAARFFISFLAARFFIPFLAARFFIPFLAARFFVSFLATSFSIPFPAVRFLFPYLLQDSHLIPYYKILFSFLFSSLVFKILPKNFPVSGSGAKKGNQNLQTWII
jgi:hypothetical protein